MFKKAASLIICLAIPLAIGALSGYLTQGGINHWYRFINKPGFTPPDFIFAPVWAILYVLMGISLFMIINTKEDSRHNGKAYFIWAIQLALNFLWSFIFFNMQEIGLALIEIILLLISIGFMIVIFYPVSRNASLLQIPYLAWVLFAATLNLVIWELN